MSSYLSELTNRMELPFYVLVQLNRSGVGEAVLKNAHSCFGVGRAVYIFKKLRFNFRKQTKLCYF